MNNRVRYTVENIINNRFYQMPKFLLEGEFKELSNDARVLYSLLRDRHELSLSNNWINDNNEVYLIFTREEMAELLGCSQPTLRKAIKQLIEFGLMEEERQGLNRPNIIYLTAVNIENTGVKNSFSPECKDFSFQSEKNFQSRVKESFNQECKNLSPNDTNINDTNINDTNINDTNINDTNINDTNINDTNINDTNINDTNINDTNISETKSISMSNKKELENIVKIDKFDRHTNILYEANKNRDIGKERREDFNDFSHGNIGVNGFTEYEMSRFNYIIQKAELDYIDPRYKEAVKRALLELFFNSSIKIGGKPIPRWVLIQELEKITHIIIEHALNKFIEASKNKRIKNTISYLATCIYNSISEISLDVDSELAYQGLIT